MEKKKELKALIEGFREIRDRPGRPVLVVVNQASLDARLKPQHL